MKRILLTFLLLAMCIAAYLGSLLLADALEAALGAMTLRHGALLALLAVYAGLSWIWAGEILKRRASRKERKCAPTS